MFEYVRKLNNSGNVLLTDSRENKILVFALRSNERIKYVICGLFKKKKTLPNCIKISQGSWKPHSYQALTKI